jgi:putative transposase
VTTLNPYHGFRYPAEVTQHAVWLYHCFSLSPREVELVRAARGVVVSYESTRASACSTGKAGGTSGSTVIAFSPLNIVPRATPRSQSGEA